MTAAYLQTLKSCNKGLKAFIADIAEQDDVYIMIDNLKAEGKTLEGWVAELIEDAKELTNEQ